MAEKKLKIIPQFLPFPKDMETINIPKGIVSTNVSMLYNVFM